jgi:hypothetical protein
MLAERYKIVPVMNSANFTMGLNGASVNMSGFHQCTFVVTLGVVAGASLVIQVFSALLTATRTTALAVRYAYGSAAIGSALADVLADWTISATTGVPVGDTAYDNFMCVIEVDAKQMPSNHNWLTIYPNGGTSGVAHIVAYLLPRFKSNQSVTALA